MHGSSSHLNATFCQSQTIASILVGLKLLVKLVRGLLLRKQGILYTFECVHQLVSYVKSQEVCTGILSLLYRPAKAER